jgi:phosphomevalonate kinase
LTRIAASAPGKLVILGEYAVLEGAPALVLAIDRRAHATLTPAAGAAWEIASPTLGLEARLAFRAGAPAWVGAAAPELAWIATLLARFAPAAALAPQRLVLDTDAFYFEFDHQRSKLGLGSSAALTVALLGGLHALAHRPPPTLSEAIAAHRAIQDGHGSGIDVAAALTGGLARFTLRDGAGSVEPLALPAGLAWRCAYAGRPTSTPAMLARVAAWRARAPAAFARQMRELATISGGGIDAVANADAATFLSSLDHYFNTLARLGTAADADIASREHRALAALAHGAGCVYKSCGAGGGDVGVTFGVEDEALRAFATRAAVAGYPVIELAADSTGLSVVAAD